MTTIPLLGSAPFAVLDAARGFDRIVLARMVAPRHANLFAGRRGQEMEDLAPHLFALDPHGGVAELVLLGQPGEHGLLIDADATFEDLHHHLRRFLTVIRARDRKRVYFRFYDPRVLRVFLPVCTPVELTQFFGPITAIHCQTEEPGHVVTSRLDNGRLVSSISTHHQFLHTRYGVYPSDLNRMLDTSKTLHAR